MTDKSQVTYGFDMHVSNKNIFVWEVVLILQKKKWV